MKESVIEIKDLNVSYDKNTRVLSNINLDIPANVRAAIVGPNGAGKSTLIKSILDLVDNKTGSIKIFNKNLNAVRDKIAYVPQRSNVNWDFPITVFDVVLMGRYQHLSLFRRPKKEDKQIAMEALKEMKMEDFADRHISQLSGGQKQRVFIARALCQDADLYILDEPLAGVDKNTEKIIMDKFTDLQKKGKTVIAVHHDLGSLKEYFDYLIILNHDVKVAGPIETSLSQENIDKAYSIRS